MNAFFISGLYEGLDRVSINSTWQLDPTVDKASGGSVTRTVTYYPVGGAMRINSTLYYVLKDHLGSASVVTDASGNTVGEQRYYPYGETRFSTGTIYTDKLFTGQREMAGLGIYHYQARFYSPKLGRFLSADTIVPGYANPQTLNRYSYVLGNPLKYTDPTGHMQYEDTYTSSTGKCKPGDPSCNWVGKSNQTTKSQPTNTKGDRGTSTPAIVTTPQPGAGHSREGDCKTVSCKALNGDLGAIADLLVPSHFGVRWQGELSLSIGGGIGLGPSGTVGMNVVFNRKSGELAAFSDWSGEGGAGAGLPVGASITVGPIVGWGSSTVKDVAVGNSAIVSGTVAPDLAVSFSGSVPVDGDTIQNMSLHVDPVYGQVPATLYGGGGIGTVYAGMGAGGSHVWASAVIDLFP